MPTGTIVEMRILRLTTSDDFTSAIPEGAHAWEIAEATASALIGEPVETVIKVIWPSPGIPGILERWLERYEPDLVFLTISSYWFTYELLHRTIEEKLGPLAPLVRPMREKVTTTEVVASSWPVRTARVAASYVIDGKAHFTTAEVIDRVGACMRLVLGREQTLLVVRGPNNSFAANGSERAFRRADRRRQTVEAAVSQQCAKLHVPYIATRQSAEGSYRRPKAAYLADGLHNNLESHRQRGMSEGEVIAAAWCGSSAGTGRPSLGRVETAR
ncbi:hypothetical protein AYO38_11275 [bacterium SCGC AG-212-C10]|nr:hypothetical protein AYO38_11275 [bacterium SCGC AG-212-C10]